ncbi:sensor histidine kinase [Magnetospira sp. QH-2]|uniref:sensor histidine kinase n=1 Tax=Magnetospira sp. (strain QH-2) TaxID=1288970 RepID=UPI0011DDFD00|nr:sensor histidine kinase [Magnetospira sp. QH-2]
MADSRLGPDPMFDTIIDIFQGFGLLALLASVYILLRQFTETAKAKAFRSVILGVFFGCMAATVMLDPIQLPQGATFDPRGGPAILAGVFAGPIGAAFATLIGSLVRWYVVGGPVAFGGVIGFLLYGLFGALAGHYLSRANRGVSLPMLMGLGAGGTLFVLPAFFVSADFNTGIAILKAAGPILLLNNVIGAVIVGSTISAANKWLELRDRLSVTEQENQLLARIARETVNGVVVTDRLGKVEWVNDGFQRLTGYDLDDLLGKAPGQVLQGPGTDPETVRYIGAKLRNCEPFRVEILNYMKSGNPYWIEIDCQPFTDAQGTTKFMAIETDITNRKNAEEQLIVAKNAAEEALRVKSDFMASMSHEMRTPMNAILGFAQVLESSKKDPLSVRQMNQVQHIRSAGKVLLELIDQVLNLEHIESGKLAPSIRPVRIAELCNDLRDSLNDIVEEYQVSLIFDVDSDTHVPADPMLLKRVLFNLLSNAIKYNRENGAATLSTKDMENGHLGIFVTDTGEGIPEDLHEQLFEPFNRLHRKSGAIEGAGVGLTATKKMVEAMGGTLNVRSKPGDGATFWLELPQ